MLPQAMFKVGELFWTFLASKVICLVPVLEGLLEHLAADYILLNLLFKLWDLLCNLLQLVIQLFFLCVAVPTCCTWAGRMGRGNTDMSERMGCRPLSSSVIRGIPPSYGGFPKTSRICSVILRI